MARGEIQLSELTKQFADGTTAVDELTLTAPTGRITVLVGICGPGDVPTSPGETAMPGSEEGTFSFNES